jgi:hypothetical protein
MRTGSANLTRGSLLVVSVTLSLLSVESALDGDVPAPRPFSVTSYRWQTWQSERGRFSVYISVTGSTDEPPDARHVLASNLTPLSGTAISVTKPGGLVALKRRAGRSD